MRSAVWKVVLALVLFAPAVYSDSSTSSAGLAVPDFSGHWKFHEEKSASLAREGSARSVSPILGSECTIAQTADILTFDIVVGGLKLRAVYRLDGQPSENRSPGPPGRGDIPIVSTIRWESDVLLIHTKSESMLGGKTVQVGSIRRIWITPAGDLAVERQGTPSQVVSNAWSVYQRVKAEPGMFTRYKLNLP